MSERRPELYRSAASPDSQPRPGNHPVTRPGFGRGPPPMPHFGRRPPGANALSESSLPIGKLPNEVLGALLHRYVVPGERVVLGPGVGRDAAVIDMGDRYLVAKTDPITFATRRDRLVPGERQRQRHRHHRRDAALAALHRAVPRRPDGRRPGRVRLRPAERGLRRAWASPSAAATPRSPTGWTTSSWSGRCWAKWRRTAW